MSKGPIPRLIRQKSAPGYLAVDKNKFNAEIRPYLTEIPLGAKSLAYFLPRRRADDAR